MSKTVGRVGTLDVPATACETLDVLSEEIHKSCDCPVNMLQVTALLEAGGITDTIAQRRYGFTDVFALAEAVVTRLPQLSQPVPGSNVLPVPEDPRWETVTDYLRGPMALLPMVLLSLIIMVYQGFGQWQIGQVLTLSMSMMGSLLVTSGFVQAASRKGSSYLSQGYVQAAGRTIGLVMAAALLTVLITVALFIVITLTLAWLPISDIILMAVAYVTLSCLWLAAPVLAMLNQMHWFGIGLGIGAGLSYAGLQGLVHFGLPRGTVMLIATGLGLAGALGVMLLVIRHALAREAATSTVSDHRVVLAPWPQLFVNLFPYFVYGVLYVLFILSGHVAGWVGVLPGGVERMQAFATTEMGLTVALGGYILASGVAERTMRRFWRRVKTYQLQTPQASSGSFSQIMHDFYLKERNHFVMILLLSSVFILTGVLVTIWITERAGMIVLPWTSATTTVLVLGLLGYGLMALGVFNCMFMITLSRPWQAVSVIILGILATLGGGMGISKLLPYQYSATGMVIGGLVFIYATYLRLQNILTHADYFYYASF